MIETRRPPTIGERIRTRRELRGMSMRTLAGLAGIDHRTLGRIEDGTNAATNRHTLAALAAALQCSPSDLTGQPPMPTDSRSAAIAAAAHRTVQALLDTDPDLPSMLDPERVRPMPVLVREIDWLQDKQLACDYGAAIAALPDLLLELHAHRQGDRAAALRGTVLAARQASVILKCVGYAAEGWVAAERAATAAVELGDPILIGLASWARCHAATSTGAYARSRLIADSGLEVLRDEQDDLARKMRGALHLVSGWAELGLGHHDDGHRMLALAEGIAGDTGPGDPYGLAWGQANIQLWHVNAAIEASEAERAVELAGNVRVDELPASRQAVLYIDLARGLLALDQDDRALRMLLTAERVAPQRTRLSPMTSETVRVLLERRARTDASGLQGIAERVGMLT